jgi:hypothetical protein
VSEQGSYVTRSSSTSVPNNTDVYIDFESETRDDGDFWDSGNSDRFIIKEAGWYDIGGHGIWKSSDGTGRRVIHIRVNGTSITSSSQYYYRQSIDATYYLEKDDYVQISVFWGSAGTATLDSAAMWISRLATGPQGETGSLGLTGIQGHTGLKGIAGGIATGMLNFIMNNAGEDLVTGIKGDIILPFDLQVDSWQMLAGDTGSARIDLLLGDYDNYPPVTGSQMHAGVTGPFITDGIKERDLDLSGWAGATGKTGDIILVDLVAVTGMNRLSLALKYHQI